MMNRVTSIAREIAGLVIDDGILAAAVVAWACIVWFLIGHLGLPPSWGALALCIGLAALLVESVLRRARR